MVLICTKCEARLQVDDTKAPARPFTVRCPKCQTNVTAQNALDDHNLPAVSEVFGRPESAVVVDRSNFEPAVSASRYNSAAEDSTAAPQNSLAGMNELAKLLADALRNSHNRSSSNRKRPAWDVRKALVCTSPAYRETIARLLADNEYQVFVAAKTSEALSQMREEQMDVIVLDANFDPVEQGVAFVTREVKLLRPSERRRLFFVYLTAGVRTMDLHAAFLNNVNLVINPSDLDQLPEVLEVSIRHYNELYHDFCRALELTPF